MYQQIVECFLKKTDFTWPWTEMSMAPLGIIQSRMLVLKSLPSPCCGRHYPTDHILTFGYIMPLLLRSVKFVCTGLTCLSPSLGVHLPRQSRWTGSWFPTDGAWCRTGALIWNLRSCLADAHGTARTTTPVITCELYGQSSWLLLTAAALGAVGDDFCQVRCLWTIMKYSLGTTWWIRQRRVTPTLTLF